MKRIKDEAIVAIVLATGVDAMGCIICGWVETWDEDGMLISNTDIDDHVIRTHSLDWSRSRWNQRQRVLR